MGKNEIFENGYYSNLPRCPKCRYKGSTDSSIIEGKPAWILDKKFKNKNYEYICGNCFFTWMEAPNKKILNEDKLLETIQHLEKKYQNILLNYNELSKRVEKLEIYISKKQEIIDINVELDGEEKVKKHLYDNL